MPLTEKQCWLLWMESETIVHEQLNRKVWSTGAMFSIADKLCWM